MNTTCIFGIVAVATIGMFPLTAQAQSYSSRNGDSAVSQQSSQNANVAGNSNTVNKYIQVININRSPINRGQRASGNRAVVQNQSQGVDVRGDRNRVRQTAQQSNSNRGANGYVDMSI